jgi:hypothetical protein
MFTVCSEFLVKIIIILIDEHRYAQEKFARGLFDCTKDIGGPCGLTTKCCGSLDCYYANGYDPIQVGYRLEENSERRKGERGEGR